MAKPISILILVLAFAGLFADGLSRRNVETTENGSYNRRTLGRSKIVFIDGVRD